MVSSEMIQQLREKAKRNLDAKIEGTNKTMKVLPPDKMIDRLKMVLYRTMPMMNVVGNNEAKTTSEAMLLELLEQLCNATADSIKWISFHSGVSYNAPFGDDSLIIKFEDMILGTPFDGESDQEDDEFEDILFDSEEED